MHIKKATILCILIILGIANFNILSFANETDYQSDLGEIGVIIPKKISTDNESPITRQETISILNIIYKDDSKKENFTLPETPTFTDVPKDNPYYYEIELANHLGITSGIGNGKFGLDEKIEGRQAILLILNTLGYYTGDISYDLALEDTAYLYGASITCKDCDSNTIITKKEFYEILYKTLTNLAGYKDSDASVAFRSKNLNNLSVENFNGDENLIKVYGYMVNTKNRMQEFLDSYIFTSPVDSSASPAYKLISKNQFIEETGVLKIKCCGRSMYYIDEYGYFFNDINSTFFIEDGDDMKFSTSLESTEGYAETYGKIMSIRKYPAKNGKTPYILVVDESVSMYDDEKRTSYDTVKRGYIGILFSPEIKNYTESIMDMSYLTSYSLYSK